jgi:hypothetical protein
MRAVPETVQGRGSMTKQIRTDISTTQDRSMKSAAAAPSENTERPDGLAFDVAAGADLPGVPLGDQTPRNPDAARTEEAVRESGEGVGLAVPRAPEPKTVKPADDPASEA